MRLAPDSVDALVQLALVLAVLVMALQLLRLNAWRAWLFLFPSHVGLRPVTPGAVPPALGPWVEQVLALGFVPVGAHVQHSRLQRGERVSPEKGTSRRRDVLPPSLQPPQTTSFCHCKG